jgi:phosphoadenosine phosphosulfate reductase
MDRERIQGLSAVFQDKTAEDVLCYFLSPHPPLSPRGEGKDEIVFGKDEGKERIALASSLGAEDQVLTHMVLAIDPKARIFILDTGRFHSETYDLIQQTMRRYGINYETFFPEASDVEEMVRIHGPNLFYDSIENRKKCCNVRKVKPLQRALSTLEVWITGLRKGQAVTRSAVEKVEWDEANGLIKLNPLADWSEEQVWDYIRQNAIPYNVLHDQGYPSIGCMPCTRKVLPGEDIRSGRWWWETPEQKECGLHIVDGKVVRKGTGNGSS